MFLSVDSIAPVYGVVDESNIFVRGEHAQQAIADGASFPAIPTRETIERWKSIVATTVLVTTIGTTQLYEHKLPEVSQKIAFRLPASFDSAKDEAATEARIEHYRRLRAEIVASGLPMLDDQELRDEIESRKGDRLRIDE